MKKRTGGKKKCKYYDACGTKENCSRCKGKSAIDKHKDEVYRVLANGLRGESNRYEESKLKSTPYYSSDEDM